MFHIEDLPEFIYCFKFKLGNNLYQKQWGEYSEKKKLDQSYLFNKTYKHKYVWRGGEGGKKEKKKKTTLLYEGSLWIIKLESLT